MAARRKSSLRRPISRPWPARACRTGSGSRRAGRLWTFGYLNEHHAHGDDFADRPLPYKAFLDGAYNDDGVQLSIVLPGDLYKEIGGGVFRGGDIPFGGSETGREAYSAYVRLGGDLTAGSALRVGAYVLDGEAVDRAGVHGHEEDEHAHEDGDDHEDHDHAEFFSEGSFSGDTRLFGVDFRYNLRADGQCAGTGN